MREVQTFLKQSWDELERKRISAARNLRGLSILHRDELERKRISAARKRFWAGLPVTIIGAIIRVFVMGVCIFIPLFFLIAILCNIIMRGNVSAEFRKTIDNGPFMMIIMAIMSIVVAMSISVILLLTRKTRKRG
ncbi:MAG: hypothetical protein ACYC26_10820 [Phycisphaerales bacterium]